MISDIDLVQGEVVQPEKEVAPPKTQAVRPVKKGLSPKAKRRLWLLLFANVVMWGTFYYFWNADRKAAILEFLQAKEIEVTGVMYNPENPSAIVSGKVVQEGDTVGDYKVVKIYRNFFNDTATTEIYTEQVHK
jgi:hypothetical protein